MQDDALNYPVLFLRTEFFVVLQGPPLAIMVPGLLIDANGIARRIVEYDSRSRRLVCDGPPTTLSADEVRRKVAWLVSARGHFESPEGFRLPPGLDDAGSVEQVILLLKDMN